MLLADRQVEHERQAARERHQLHKDERRTCLTCIWCKPAESGRHELANREMRTWHTKQNELFGLEIRDAFSLQNYISRIFLSIVLVAVTATLYMIQRALRRLSVSSGFASFSNLIS